MKTFLIGEEKNTHPISDVALGNSFHRALSVLRAGGNTIGVTPEHLVSLIDLARVGKAAILLNESFHTYKTN